jgi:hypothetical protein
VPGAPNPYAHQVTIARPQPPSKGFPTGVVVVLVLLAAILAALVTAARKLRITRR